MVALPPMMTAQHMLGYVTLGRQEPDLHWASPAYESVTLWTCDFHDVLVHGAVGIVVAGENVVEDTLRQTNPQLQHYQIGPAGITLQVRGEVARLEGSCLSLLGGNYVNYYHWTLEGLGRLAAADEMSLKGTSSVLVPEFTTGVQADGFALTGLAGTHDVRHVAPHETFHVRHMVVPWSVTRYHRPHPCIRPFFGRLRSAAKTGPGPRPTRVYVDRRGADRRAGAHRCLVNEDDLVAALARYDFVPVRLEELSLAQQISLFANAHIIVAPHGAGLANLVYASPGCTLIELHMDDWVNWCFRHLAAVFDVIYDCTVGRRIAASETSGATRLWSISVMHVLGAVETALARYGGGRTA